MLPYKEGGSSKHLIDKQGSISFYDMVHYAIDIAKALIHMHQHGYVHNDSALRNVVLEGSTLDRAAPADFGLSRRIGSTERLKTVPWRFTAPEVPQAKGCNFSAASDVWMFGLVKWHKTLL